jgi:hypothetical protein
LEDVDADVGIVMNVVLDTSTIVTVNVMNVVADATTIVMTVESGKYLETSAFLKSARFYIHGFSEFFIKR